MYFSDENDLGFADGDKVLGRTLPLAGRVEVCKTVRLQGPEGRYRFTVAHELGHWILHRPLFLARRSMLDFFDHRQLPTAVISLNRNVFPSGTRPPPAEWQANRFAVALLVDADHLRREFEYRFQKAPIVAGSNDPMSVARDIACSEVGAAPSLRDAFGLSAEAMAIALRTRGYVTENPPLL